ncbi:hypothetical protein ACS5PK_04650 [Roseateles sp. DB2]
MSAALRRQLMQRSLASRVALSGLARAAVAFPERVQGWAEWEASAA